MKRLTGVIRAGAKEAPAYLILLYFIFFVLDSYTTYLASPDLKLESNWIVRKYNLGWDGIIIKDVIIFTTVTAAVIITLNFLPGYLRYHNFTSYKKLIFNFFRNIKLFLSLIVLGTFYSHLINLAHIVVNNYMVQIFLHWQDGWMKDISEYYILRQKYFLFYIQYCLVVPGYIIAVIKIKSIWNKVVLTK